jgi:tetratricopeptide (TPR) repeat protein
LGATLHDWGRRSQNQELLQQAEGLYHRCLDISPDHVDCHRALAVLLVDTNRRDSAFTLLERWAARNPQRADPRIELARLYEEFGDGVSARQYLTQALDVDSTSSRAWAALGRLRENEGRLAQALTDYQHALNLNRQQPGLSQRIAYLQQRVAQAPTPMATEPRLSRSPSQWIPR